jgi:hypothetical protein
VKTASKMKRLTVAGTIALVGLSGSSAAFAATATGTNNPDLTVSVSVTPDQLHVGNTATVNESVTNHTSLTQTVSLSNTLVTPKGQTYVQASPTIQVPAGQAVNLAPEHYTISSSDPKGTYSLTFSAKDGNGTSSATTQYSINR